MDVDISPSKIKEIIEKRIALAPNIIKTSFPSVLQHHPVSWVTVSQPAYLLIVFLNPGDETRISEFKSKNIDPFPGLITLENKGAAFRVDKARYMILQDCAIENAYTLSLGIDSTIMIAGHKQTIKNQESGVIEYQIPLSYIISYGQEINKVTVYEYLEGLLAYSINMWRGARV